MSLLCKIGIHRRKEQIYSPLSQESRRFFFSALPVATEWYCERCGHTERFPVMDWDGTDNG